MSSNNQSCRVWSRFEREKKDGSLVKLRIQEPPSSAMESVLDFVSEYFLREEAFQKAAGIITNPEAVAEYRGLLGAILQSWIIVICCHDNETEEVGEILGVSAVQLIRDETFDGLQIQTKELQNLFNIMVELEKLVKPLMTEFDFHHDGRGITVHPNYRGLGIASEFVKIRRLMINEQNVPMSCAWMTSIGSQKAAEKDNWETLFEISPEELSGKCDVVFKDPPRTFKLMLVRNNSEQ